MTFKTIIIYLALTQWLRKLVTGVCPAITYNVYHKHLIIHRFVLVYKLKVNSP